ncbi:MAG TPA: hypothetical protein VJB60_02795, partial [Candidatus Peribacterales bacterium]|nr:hypothetical protein [Candidatus Peribacterales bacterium]
RISRQRAGGSAIIGARIAGFAIHGIAGSIAASSITHIRFRHYPKRGGEDEKSGYNRQRRHCHTQ